jgi:hypothetical protein
VDTLALRVEPRRPEEGITSANAGLLTISNGRTQGYLLLPEAIDPERAYPLVTVLHGAGRQDELLVRAYRDEPARRRAIFFIPRSTSPTWDLLLGADRPDLDFLEHAYAGIYRRVLVDHQAGSDRVLRRRELCAGDRALEPRIFAAIMGWAAGSSSSTRPVSRPPTAGPASFSNTEPMTPSSRSSRSRSAIAVLRRLGTKSSCASTKAESLAVTWVPAVGARLVLQGIRNDVTVSHSPRRRDGGDRPLRIRE